jgi:3-phenylpropionate/trans-cinnamate dioxygenase ferredoxin reductase component
VSDIVVVGGGQAGARAAQAARDSGHAGRIIIVSEEKYAPYQRPPLSKAVLVSDEGGFGDVALNPAPSYAQARIAQDQGSAAGRSAAGQAVSYVDRLWV